MLDQPEHVDKGAPNRYEIRAFIEETHELLTKAANGNLSDQEEDRILELERYADDIINSGKFSYMKIIHADGAGPSDNPLDPTFNSLSNVDSIEAKEVTKVLKINGEYLELVYKRYRAIGTPKEIDTGEKTPAGHPITRMASATVSSGAEGFIERNGKYIPFGAASALVARLFEARAAH